MNNSHQVGFSPSKGLIDLIQKDLAKEKFKEISDNSLFGFIYGHICTTIPSYLTTISLGLYNGEESCFTLTKDGELTESVLKGLLFRLPGGVQYSQLLSKYLVDDLMKAASSGLLNNQYANLEVSNNELVLVRTKLKQEPQPSDWKKSTVFQPR